MKSLRVLYSGESHMDGLCAVIEGFPAGFEFDEERINRDLMRRQIGYGRGPRMSIEKDRVVVYSGVIGGRTIGSPITLLIPNKDNRRQDWNASDLQTVPRPGHADLPGAVKYRFKDIRLVAERASARQTAAWSAVGSLLMQFLEKFNIKIMGFVNSIGGIEVHSPTDPFSVKDVIEKSPLRIAEPAVFEDVKKLIDKAREEGETLGGTFTVVVRGVPIGLGSYVHPDRRLDAELAGAFMGIPSVKAVEIGDGFKLASLPGSHTSDPIKPGGKRFERISNHAGGIEGGVSNGQDIVIHAAAKPIPTLKSPIHSIDMETMKPADSPYIRSDVCVVPAVSVIGEMVASRVIAEAFLERFGADTFEEVYQHYRTFKDEMEEIFEID